VLTPDGVRRLLDATSGDRFEAAFYILGLTGARIGECLALDWNSVDLEAGP